MTVYTADWGGIGTLLLVVFVIIPSIRWSIGMGSKAGGRWGRRQGQVWGVLGGEHGWDGGGSSRREIATLRAELETKLGEVDDLTNRVAELENRLDFAERLLAQRSEDHSLPAHRSPAP
ncbi:MAG: hypothetical protein ACKVZ0_02410 [Gemmatimonadales bacterium]